MTWRRWLLVAAAGLTLGAAAAIGGFFFKRADLTRLVIARIEQRSGLQLVAARRRLTFSTHLILELDKPVVFDHGHEVMRLRQLRLAFSYRAITRSDALPLYSIVLDSPRMATPIRSEQVTATAIPRL